VKGKGNKGGEKLLNGYGKILVLLGSPKAETRRKGECKI